MCVSTPVLLADLDVANRASYPQPPTSPQQGLASVFAATTNPAGSRLPDYGLCAYDAGLTTSLRQGLERGALAADRLALAPAKWYALPPPSTITGGPSPVLGLVDPGLQLYPTTDLGGVLRVGDAGMAGNFSLADEEWQVLPRRFARGFSVEMALYVGPTLLPALRTTPESGTFFYWGTRAADKFWQVADVTGSAYRLNTGVPLEETHPKDPIDGLQLHALALRALPDGAVQVRWLDESAGLQQAQTVGGVLRAGWLHLVLSWCPEQALPEDPELAECWPFRRGVLRLVVNGRQQLCLDHVPELRHRNLPGPASQQYTVPYYLSWGGGTPGWRHAFVPSDAAGTPVPYVYEPTILEQGFGGNLPGLGLRRLRVYGGAVTPLLARSLATQYSPALVWGRADPLLATGW